MWSAVSHGGAGLADEHLITFKSHAAMAKRTLARASKINSQNKLLVTRASSS
jgi:hypothetical protein